jgi:hypothetical protein
VEPVETNEGHLGRLYFLAPDHPDHAVLLRQHFKAENNLDWLLTYLCRAVRDLLFRVFPPRAKPDEAQQCVRAIGEALSHAVLNKLREQHPKEAHRDASKLVRWYPDRAGALVNQAIVQLAEVWISDCAQHPRDSLNSRCDRLLPKLGALKGRRGHSASGAYAQLYFLWAYEEAMRILKGLPRSSPARADFLQNAFEDLTAQTPQALLESGAFRHPDTGDIFFEISDEDLDGWRFRSRHEIAQDVAVRAVRGQLALGADTLHRLLPTLRRLAKKLDQALAQS